MALVNIAGLMAKQNKKILLIDWDLEAPGLNSFFDGNTHTEKLGLVDLVTDLIEQTQPEVQNTEEFYNQFLHEHLQNYTQQNLQLNSSGFYVDIISAGKFGDEYTTKLNAIDWLAFYKRSPSFFRTFAQHLESKYDYILIDSRTGLSDTGGVCTMLMPQILVLVFALNNQNLNGVLDVAKQSLNYRLDSNDFRNLTVLPLPSRIDHQNSKDLQEWIDRYTNRFQELFKEVYLLDECRLVNYFNEAKIPYKPEHAYGEKIPVLSESINNDLFISYHYAQFCKLVTNEIPLWELRSSEEIERDRQLANSHFQKGLENYYSKNFEQACAEFEKSCSLESDANSFNNWGVSLGNLAKTKTGREADALYQVALEKFQKAVEIDENYYEAFNNWGNYLGDLAKLKGRDEAELLYRLSFEKYKKAVKIYPNYHEALYNWGNYLGNLARTKMGEEAEELFKLAFEKYQKAVDTKPEKHEVFNNWGVALGDLAKTKIGQEAEDLFQLAFEKYQKAVDIKPDKFEAYNNWGGNLGDLAKIKGKEEAEALYYLGCEKYQRSIAIKPDYYEAYTNWGNYLGLLAETKSGEAAEVLYKLAFEKFQRADEIKPNQHVTLYNWGHNLGNLAKRKVGDEAVKLYALALEKFQKGIECGGNHYNLACMYALKGDKQLAMKHLETSLIRGEITPQFVKEDADWKEYLKDPDFLKLVE